MDHIQIHGYLTIGKNHKTLKKVSDAFERKKEKRNTFDTEKNVFSDETRLYNLCCNVTSPGNHRRGSGELKFPLYAPSQPLKTTRFCNIPSNRTNPYQ